MTRFSNPQEQTKAPARGLVHPQHADVHPAPEALVAYRADRLSQADASDVCTHLVLCGECRELVLELASLETDPSRDSEAVSPIELEEAWQRQQVLLGALQETLQRQQPRVVGRGSWTAWAGWGVAAMLLMTLGALGFELRDLRRQTVALYEQDPPQIIAQEQSRRGTGAALPTFAPSQHQPGMVILLLPENLPFELYRVEVFAPNDRLLMVREPLSSRENDDLLVILVRPGSLPMGEIRFVVSGRTKNDYQRIEEYALRVREP